MQFALLNITLLYVLTDWLLTSSQEEPLSLLAGKSKP